MKARIVILTGMSGTGKTTMAEKLQEKYKWSIVNVGDVVQHILAKVSGLELIGDFRLRDALEEKIEDRTVITGVREAYLLDWLFETYEVVGCFFLFVDKEVGTQRLKQREDWTGEVITKKITDEKTIGINKVADYTRNVRIDANRSKQEVWSEVEGRLLENPVWNQIGK